MLLLCLAAYSSTLSTIASEPPIARISYTVDRSTVPYVYSFSGSDSSDPDGVVARYAWDFDDGHGSTAADPVHVFDQPGAYDVTLVVVDDSGESAMSSRGILVSGPNSAPESSSASTSSPTVQASAIGSFDLDFLSVPPFGEWNLGVTEDTEQYFRSGKFHVQSLAADSTGYSEIELPLSGDFRITTQIRRWQETPTVRAGILLHFTDPERYLLLGQSYKSYFVLENDTINAREVVPVTTSGCVGNLGTWSQLVVERLGDRLILHIDGCRLAEIPGVRTPVKRIGLFVHDGSASFDSLRLDVPPFTPMTDRRDNLGLGEWFVIIVCPLLFIVAMARGISGSFHMPDDGPIRSPLAGMVFGGLFLLGAPALILLARYVGPESLDSTPLIVTAARVLDYADVITGIVLIFMSMVRFGPLGRAGGLIVGLLVMAPAFMGGMPPTLQVWLGAMALVGGLSTALWQVVCSMDR